MDRPLTDDQRDQVEANRGLAYEYGRRMHKGYRWLCEEDVIQAALLGLCRAVRCHDPVKGTLSTIASHHMRNAVQRLVRDSSEIQTPAYTFCKYRCGVTKNIERARAVRKMHRLPSTMLASIAVKQAVDEEDLADIRRAVEGLADKHKEVVTRYVMGGETLKAIGKDWGCTKENVRRHKLNALARLREALEKS